MDKYLLNKLSQHKKLGVVVIQDIPRINVTIGKNDMVGKEISSFDAFLVCKQLSVKELFEKNT